jgi:hypothetical protein
MTTPAPTVTDQDAVGMAVPGSTRNSCTARRRDPETADDPCGSGRALASPGPAREPISGVAERGGLA